MIEIYKSMVFFRDNIILQKKELVKIMIIIVEYIPLFQIDIVQIIKMLIIIIII